MDDYELLEVVCPKCGQHPTHTRCCDNLLCEDGWVDEHEEDAVNFAPGEEYLICTECRGTGRLRWCPKCGTDLNSYREKRA